MHASHLDSLMPALQIRHLPDDLYELLSMRAQRAHRSLAQQTVVELRQALGPAGQARRQDVLQRLADEQQRSQPAKRTPTPQALVRADRNR
jgi:antitoxin FitA